MADLYESIEHGFAIMRIEEDDYVAINLRDWIESDLLSDLISQLRDAWPGLRIAVFAGDVEITRITPND